MVGWLIETLEIKLVMFSDLTSFPRQINAISDFGRQAEKQGVALEWNLLKAHTSQGKYIRKRSSFDVSNIITYVRTYGLCGEPFRVRLRVRCTTEQA